MTISGWLDPNGKMHNCDTWGHIDKVSITPELKRLVPKLDGMLEKLASISRGCQEMDDNGEHPEWHAAEMYSYSVQGEIRRALLKAGCLRVGTWRKGGTMHFEGQVTATTRQAAIDLADGYDLEPAFEDVK